MLHLVPHQAASNTAMIVRYSWCTVCDSSKEFVDCRLPRQQLITFAAAGTAASKVP